MSDTKQAIKDSINLPKTAFPMKANLNQREPEIIKKWQEQKTYHKMVDGNQGNKSFTMPDGPPYANGHMHMGHTLNKCLKDFVIKYKNMAGFHSPYIPGWDCHGLPIEHNITKKLGPKVREKTAQELRLMCREEAGKWVNTQKEEFIRLGILGQWENPYLTMNPDYEAEEVREFARNYKNGAQSSSFKNYYETGKIESEGRIRNGRYEGKELKFESKGDFQQMQNHAELDRNESRTNIPPNKSWLEKVFAKTI